MSEAVVTIPDEWMRELEPYQDRLGELLLLGLSQLRLQEALLLYQRRLVSFGRAAELARMPESDLVRYAAAMGITPNSDPSLPAEELA